MFRLSNKVFQVDFFDGSRISLKTDQKIVNIRSKKNEVRITSLEEINKEKDSEASRRMKYIREILNNVKQK
jgi:hypothetical protein